MPPDLGTTNLWLTVIAIASIVQLLLVIVGGIAAYRIYRQSVRQLVEFQQQELGPMMRRLSVVLDDASDVLGRVKSADDGVRRALDRTSATVQRVAWAAGSRERRRPTSRGSYRMALPLPARRFCRPSAPLRWSGPPRERE